MIFVLDVGNSNTVLGVFVEEELKYHWRIKTDRYKTEDEFGILIKSLFDFSNIQFHDIKGVIISSVVPPIMSSLERMCNIYFNMEPIIVGKDTVQTDLKMCYPNPKEIGADRIVNAVGALSIHDAPLVIIDFGTATTYCYINEIGEYCGGIISPGINISMEALYQRASKLPKIEVEPPENILGKSTVEAMKSGLFYGYIGQIDGIVNRIKQNTGKDAKVIATGGLASLIGEASETIDYVDPYLTLKGLYEIYKQNQ